ncbi:hypothetical protein VRRI112168_02475 [Vreelandella rituensis]|uniref:Uncharacterized protein n=1 Tax=Vreelandella rituensis TaxID=2282306 RepID=A0A368U8U8_9GAMM|nr:hypothetical protein [Halomonas rituensis]RCV93609.1 hypothetical protein DU506_00195 [Halomonas rituensis]
MANFYGVERSNYVRFQPEAMEVVAAYCDLFEIALAESDGRHCLLPSEQSEDGCFGSQGFVARDSLLCGALEGLDFQEGDEAEVDIDLSEVAKHMQPGEVLVVEKAGAEKLRYVTGFAEAYNHLGECVTLNISEIYQRAADAFGVDRNTITHASY